MKKLSIKKGVQCMACLECVRACSNAYYKEFHPDKAAISEKQKLFRCILFLRNLYPGMLMMQDLMFVSHPKRSDGKFDTFLPKVE